MSEITTVWLDLAKSAIQVHGADASGRAELRKKLRRDQVLAFLIQLQPCVVAMEACGVAHFWGREIGKLVLCSTIDPARLRQALRQGPEK